MVRRALCQIKSCLILVVKKTLRPTFYPKNQGEKVGRKPFLATKLNYIKPANLSSSYNKISAVKVIKAAMMPLKSVK